MRIRLLKNYISQNLDFYGFSNSSELYSVLYNQLSNLINGTINKKAIKWLILKLQ